MSSKKRKGQWISSSFGAFAAMQSSQHQPKKPTKRKHSSDHFFQEPTFSQSQDFDSCSTSSSLPWAEKYKPVTENDLAVHKKKIAEVKDWLLTHLSSSKDKNRGNILVLTGPAGAGKTATVDALSNDLSIELQEWNNPVTSSNEEYATWKDFRVLTTDSQRKQFQDFLLRANKYPSLSISGKHSSNSIPGKKIVLVEDIPNVFYRNVRDFHDILRQFQATNRNPLVFVISDSHMGESSLYSLFPKKIQLELHIDCISFNSIANTNLMKTMTKIINAESQMQSVKMPSKDTLDLMTASSAGDIRACINSLQFYCTNEYNSRKQNFIPRKGNSRKTISKEKSAKPKNQSSEKDDRPFSFGRDTSLFLFKALGKILYSKREIIPEAQKLQQLPRNLRKHARNKLLVDPEEVVEKTHMQNDTFNLYLHQNYLDFYTSIDDVANASSWFSDADYVTGQWSIRDVMQKYSSSVATRGIMFANSQRSSSSTGSVSGGWRPLNKPQWFQTFKEMNSNKRTAGELFHDMRHPAVILHTEVLPYLAKTNVCLRTPSHISFVQMISHFNLNPCGFSTALGQSENDATDLEEISGEAANRTSRKRGEESSVTLSQLMVETQGSNEENDSFEENLIEDFSDDDGLADFLLM